jgi:hypothetical protein
VRIQILSLVGSNAAKTDRQHRLQKLLPLARLKSFTTTLVALLLT